MIHINSIIITPFRNTWNRRAGSRTHQRMRGKRAERASEREERASRKRESEQSERGRERAILSLITTKKGVAEKKY